ncbi:MAG: hypothetical protein LAO31_07250 [Acidobacteriia bacterium]|nr:hypothetical protein [Terriglobia bacterium]
MRRACLLIIFIASTFCLSAQQHPVDALKVIQEFDRIAARDLWPGFEPAKTPIEFYDGISTYLCNHPSPPDGFRPVPGRRNVYLYAGQHETVRANTGTEVNGIPTATADVSNPRNSSAEELAALLLHEAFHVFEHQRYPKWGANEVDLFTYPVDNPALLAERRLESAALVRALGAKDDKDANCWARRALEIRAKRFGAIPANAAAYERQVELFEGLAQYVQFRSIGKSAALTADDFPPDQGQVRQRGYATGQALGLLLERFDPAWKSKLGAEQGGSLDELLSDRLRGMTIHATCDFAAEESDAAVARARRDIAESAANRKRQKQEFLDARGTRIEIVAGKEPLWPNAFDPWNVMILGNNEILHTRWIKLGNGSGTIEVLGHSALTEAAGTHPLFNGVHRLIVTGLADPKVSVSEGKVTLTASGVKATFTGTVQREPNVVRIVLP